VHGFENTRFWRGPGGGGNNVHVNLRHVHMLRHVTGLGLQKWRQAVSDQKNCQSRCALTVVGVDIMHHNASSCESLGQKLLPFLRKKTFCGSVTRLLEDELQNQKPLEVTGRSLKNRMAMWEGKKHRAPFQENFPVNYRSSSKKHFKRPGNFKPILENEPVVSLCESDFFQNAHNRWRGFPPDGMFKLFSV